MKRRRIILVLALAAVAAGFVVFWPRGPKEPVYQGKGIDFWLRLAATNNTVQAQQQAANAMRAVGTNAVPWLLWELFYEEPEWRASFNRWAVRHPTISFRFRTDEGRVNRAAVGLDLLGTGVAPYLPTLAPLLGDTNRGPAAAYAMSGAADAALSYFAKAGASTNAVEAWQGVDGLGYIANKTEAAVPPLVQALQHPDATVQRRAATLLGSVRPRRDLSAPALTKALSDSDLGVVRASARALQNMNEQAKPAIPELLRVMTNSDPKVVAAASNAVFKIDSAALPPHHP